VAVWGVTARVALADPPGRPLEEAGVEAIPSGSDALAPPLFSLVTADGASVLGSTFDRVRPDADAVVVALLERGARFVPALAGAHVRAVRVCARPVSADGAPLLGPVAGVERLHVATGHGPWGISLGPASARLAAAALLDGAEVPAELAASRF
jgi:glycine/D-amino acid oxidase-like deaminating enzyme